MKKLFLLMNLSIVFWSVSVSNSFSQTWNLAGNAGTIASNYVGTTDATDLHLGTNGIQRVKIMGTGGWPGSIKMLGTNTYFTFAGTGAGTVQFNGAQDLFFRSLTNVDDYSTYTNRMVINGTTGNIGIGKTAPIAALDIFNPGSPNIRLANNLTTIEIANPPCNGCFNNFANTHSLVMRILSATATPADPKRMIFSSGGPSSTGASFMFVSEQNIMMTVKDNSTVGIGTDCIPADGMLAVNGKIYATALQLKLTNGGCFFPDYVFSPSYKLTPLADVEKYITTNHHLKGFPTAAEVDESGINVQDLNIKMVEKIEELTLYMIELQKQNELLKKENKTLSAESESIELKLEKLEQMVQTLVNSK